MSKHVLKVSRINTGIYAISFAGRTFEVEDLARIKRENGHASSSCPDWQLYETTGGGREWWNDFATLTDAKAAVKNVIEREHSTN